MTDMHRKSGSGGARPGSGRPKGSRSTKALALEKRILQRGSGRTPLAVMLRLMDYHLDIIEAEKAKPEGERDEAALQAALKDAGIAAERAAPYMHARYQAMAVADLTPQTPTVIIAPPVLSSSQEWLAKYKPALADPDAPPTPIELAVEKQAQEAREARAIGRPWEPGDPIQ